MTRVLAVDIDGTLLDSRGQVPAAHRRALGEAIDEGIEVALVTGRSFHFTRPVASALGLPLVLIVNNGAVVKDARGATIMRHLLPRGTARRLLAETGAYDDSVALIFDRPDERQILFERMDWAHPHRQGYYDVNKAFIAAAGGPLVEGLTEDPIQVMFNGGVERMRTLAAELESLPFAGEFSVSITEYERRDFALVDVTAAGCSKGTTLARFVASRGFSPADVVAVGDNLNDVDMLAFAATAVVMGNACDALRARGWPVTGTNDEGGLAEAIERYVLTGRRSENGSRSG